MNYLNAEKNKIITYLATQQGVSGKKSDLRDIAMMFGEDCAFAKYVLDELIHESIGYVQKDTSLGYYSLTGEGLTYYTNRLYKKKN